MKKNIVIIHTVKETLNTLDSYLIANIKDDISVSNLYDDSFAIPVCHGSLEEIQKERMDRLIRLINVTANHAPDMILVACSTLSLEAELIRREVNIPIITIDEAMINAVTDEEDAVVLFATSPNPVHSVESRLKNSAELKGKEIQIETALCDNALPYLLANDMNGIKKVALNYIKDYSPKHSIVFAQMSSQFLKEPFERITGLKVYSARDYLCDEIRMRLCIN